MPAYKQKIPVPGKSAEQLFEKVSKDIGKLLAKYPIGEFKLEPVAGKKELLLKSGYFSAKISCLEGLIDIDGNLSLLATPFRGKIDSGIQGWVQKTFQT